MHIKETCIKANLVKEYKNRVITIFYFEVCSPPGPSKSIILYTCMAYLYNICKWEAGSSGGRGAYFKIEHGDDLIFLPEINLN